jgi:transcriptional regulator with XRE-family HTH domain
MRDVLATTLGRELRSARLSRGWTQAEVAERVGVAVEVYGRLERGMAVPRASTLVRLASVLEVSTDVLLGLIVRQAEGADPKALAEQEAGYPDGETKVRNIVRRMQSASPSTLRLVADLLTSLASEAETKRKRRGEKSGD